jgi:hypothetical protein
MRWTVSFLTSEVDKMQTRTTKISFTSIRCYCNSVDRQRARSFSTGYRPVVR